MNYFFKYKFISVKLSFNDIMNGNCCIYSAGDQTRLSWENPADDIEMCSRPSSLEEPSSNPLFINSLPSVLASIQLEEDNSKLFSVDSASTQPTDVSDFGRPVYIDMPDKPSTEESLNSSAFMDRPNACDRKLKYRSRNDQFVE